MIPGELHIIDGVIKLNVGRKEVVITVVNHGDRPIQIGSHFHFYEINTALKFNRANAYGFRLNIPSGTSIRFEVGQSRTITLIEYSGKRIVYGFCKAVMGKLD